MDSVPASSIVFRNGVILVAFCRLVSVGAGLIAACMTVLVFSALFPLTGMNLSRAIQIFWWAFGVLCFVSMCRSMWVYGRRLSFYHVKLDPDSVEFLFGAKDHPELVRMPWDQVRAVQHKRVANAHIYTVLAQNGASATFSSNTFLRSKKIARLIADRAHLSIEEV